MIHHDTLCSSRLLCQCNCQNALITCAEPKHSQLLSELLSLLVLFLVCTAGTRALSRLPNKAILAASCIRWAYLFDYHQSDQSQGPLPQDKSLKGNRLSPCNDLPREEDPVTDLTDESPASMSFFCGLQPGLLCSRPRQSCCA